MKQPIIKKWRKAENLNSNSISLNLLRRLAYQILLKALAVQSAATIKNSAADWRHWKPIGKKAEKKRISKLVSKLYIYKFPNDFTNTRRKTLVLSVYAEWLTDEVLSLIFSWGHCCGFSPSQTCDTLQTVCEPAQNLRLGLVDWSCALVIFTASRLHNLIRIHQSREGHCLERLRSQARIKSKIEGF